MQNAKPFFKKVDFYLMLAAVVLLLVSFINYEVNGATQYNRGELASSIVGLDIVALILGLIALALDMLAFKIEVIEKISDYTRYIKYAVFVLVLLSFLEMIVTETNFLGNMFAATDPIDSIYVTNYFLTAITSVLAAVLSIVAGSMQCHSVYRAQEVTE